MPTSRRRRRRHCARRGAPGRSNARLRHPRRRLRRPNCRRRGPLEPAKTEQHTQQTRRKMQAGEGHHANHLRPPPLRRTRGRALQKLEGWSMKCRRRGLTLSICRKAAGRGCARRSNRSGEHTRSLRRKYGLPFSALAPIASGCGLEHHSPRHILGNKCNKDLQPERSNGHLTALDSDAALNTAWARHAGMISYLPRSARVATRHCAAGHVCMCVVLVVVLAGGTCRCCWWWWWWPVKMLSAAYASPAVRSSKDGRYMLKFAKQSSRQPKVRRPANSMRCTRATQIFKNSKGPCSSYPLRCLGLYIDFVVLIVPVVASPGTQTQHATLVVLYELVT